MQDSTPGFFEPPKLADSRPHIHAAYRPDIDGLRAVAVGAVVCFHAFPSLLPGGFVGVDVFFVISGYLISGIIVDKLRSGEFSFVDFYGHRIRRIFPALLVVLGSVYLIGWSSLLNEEFRLLGSHIASATLFISNFKFLSEAGYFDQVAEMKPLLHLWSLAVEEQFYIVWPLALWVAYKLRLRLSVVTWIVAALSFAANVIAVHQGRPEFAFFSPGTRFWELMLGAALVTTPVFLRARTLPWPAVIGMATIGLSTLLIARTSPFPGWLALLPTMGAALLIGAGPDAWVNRAILSHRILTAVGLISYPLYLWHWPLLSMVRIYEGDTPAVTVRLAVVLVSLALAWFTYQVVEKPIRHGTIHILKASAALGVAMIAVGLTGLAARSGMPAVLTNPILINDGETLAETGHGLYFKYLRDHFFPCTPESLRDHQVAQFAPARCLQSKPTEFKDVAILGDSHAEDLFVGLAESRTDKNFVTYIRSIPIRSLGGFGEILDYVESDAHIREVILTSWWNWHAKNDAAAFDLVTELRSTVAELIKAGKTVYLVDDRPTFQSDPTSCKYLRPRLFWQLNHKPHCELERSIYERQRSEYQPLLAAIKAQLPEVRILDTIDAFCDDKLCYMGRNGSLYFRDTNHLTVSGSRELAKTLANLIYPRQQ